MKVPVYERQVNTKTQALTPPPAAAFGADIAEAQGKQAEAVGKIAGILSDHIIKWQEAETHKKILDADTAFRTDLQNTLYDPTPDENGTPKGLLMRQGENAKGSAQAFDLTVGDLIQKHAKALPGGAANNFMRLANNSAGQHRDNVIRNEAAQLRASFEASVKANIAQRVSDATNAPDAEAAYSVAMTAASIMKQSALRNGDRPEVAKLAAQGVLSQSVLNYISTHAETDYSGAQALFDKAKPNLSAEGQAAGEKMLKGARLVNLQQTTWESIKFLRSPDGLPDTFAMLEKVEAMKFDPAEKERVQDYVRAKASEDTRMIQQLRAANDRNFFNELYRIKQEGAGLDAALKLAGKSGYDAYDAGLKQEAAKRIYTEPEVPHPAVYMDLWRGIQDKAGSQDAIDAAFKKGNLSVSEWQGLSKEFYRQRLEGEKIERKNMDDRIELLATEKFGSDKERKDKFLYEMRLATQDMSPAEAWKTVQDKLGKAGGLEISTPWFRIGTIGGEPAYKREGEERDAYNLAEGKLQQDLGAAQFEAIKRGMAELKGNSKFEISDIDEFAKPFGGYDGIKPGTAAHKAIQFLMEKQKTDSSALVTPSNVKAVVDYYKLKDDEKEAGK